LAPSTGDILSSKSLFELVKGSKFSANFFLSDLPIFWSKMDFLSPNLVFAGHNDGTYPQRITRDTCTSKVQWSVENAYVNRRCKRTFSDERVRTNVGHEDAFLYLKNEISFFRDQKKNFINVLRENFLYEILAPEITKLKGN